MAFLELGLTMIKKNYSFLRKISTKRLPGCDNVWMLTEWWYYLWLVIVLVKTKEMEGKGSLSSPKPMIFWKSSKGGGGGWGIFDPMFPQKIRNIISQKIGGLKGTFPKILPFWWTLASLRHCDCSRRVSRDLGLAVQILPCFEICHNQVTHLHRDNDDHDQNCELGFLHNLAKKGWYVQGVFF